MPDFDTSIEQWYRLKQRTLPWRENQNPYFVWLSEVMLQQTRVDQATEFFNKFKQNFPTICDLAKAEEDEILNHWQGLGYYSRARNLHAAAKTVCFELNGIFPDTYTSIKSLKGIGDYTAAAIASISFNLPHAVVDGNVYRVLSRYFGIDLPIDSTQGKKHFLALANELLNTRNPGNYNQAIMEFGALQCVPRNPNCDACPLQDSCEALSQKRVQELPVKIKKTSVKSRYIDYFIVTNTTELLIRKRTGKDIWQGLYDFPSRDSYKKLPPPKNEFEFYGAKKPFLDVGLIHLLSHQKINANFWILEVKNLKDFDDQCIKLKDLENYPLPQLLVKYLKSSPYFKYL